MSVRMFLFLTSSILGLAVPDVRSQALRTDGSQAIKHVRIDSIEPTSGMPGTTVTIRGANFGTGSVDEVIVLAEGEGNFMFDIVSRDDGQIVAELVSVDPDAVPSRLIVARGIGDSDTIPPQGDIDFGEGVEGWCGDLSDPNKATVSDIVFHPEPGPGARGECGTPPSTQYLRWRKVGNEGCLDLPASWCPGEELFISLVIRRNNVDRVMCRSLTLGNSTGPIVVGSAIVLAINTGMFLANIPCFATYDPGANKIIVQCPNATISKVAGYLCRSFNDTSVLTFQDETKDDFTSPTPTYLIPGSEFEAWVAANCPQGESEAFDEIDSNRCFAHTMVFTPATVVGANLEIRVRAHGDVSDNDSLKLGFVTGAFEWGRSLSDLTGLAWEWGDTATVCLDLARLPNADGTRTNLLESLGSGDLEILVNDDSVVDYVTLRVRTCD